MGMDGQETTTLVGLIGPRRKALRLSMQRAADQAGVHRLTWSAWEKGRAQPEEYNHAGIDAALQLPAGTVDAVVAGKPFFVPEPAPPMTRQERARSVIVNASLQELNEMAHAYAEAFGEAEGEAFLLRALEIRTAAETGEKRAPGTA